MKVCKKCDLHLCRSAGQVPFVEDPRMACHRRAGLPLAYVANLQPAAFLYTRFLLRHRC